jgi:5-formyltetrahydrofolate cyclo-ligase
VKTKYRKSILKIRDTLSSSEVSNLSNEMLQKANLELGLDKIKVLGSYFSINNEVNLDILTSERFQKNLLTTFPKVGPDNSMSLIAPKNLRRLNKNKYGIFEPSDGDEFNPADHEIIIIPSVGVDKNGFRLGYGGGYYDRFLESILQVVNRPLLIGLIYDFQFINNSINEVHDIKLDMVFSEHQIKKFA